MNIALLVNAAHLYLLAGPIQAQLSTPKRHVLRGLDETIESKDPGVPPPADRRLAGAGSPYAGTHPETGVVTDTWGIRGSAFPSDVGPEPLACLTDGLRRPKFYRAALALNCDSTVPANYAATVDGDPGWMQGKSSMCDDGFIRPSGSVFVAIDQDNQVSVAVSFENLNPYANTPGAAAEAPGAQTPIVGLHLHRAGPKNLAPPLVFFCGQLTAGRGDLTLGPAADYDRPVPGLDSLPNNLGAPANWWPSDVPEDVWAARAPNLPPCSQNSNQLYRGKFMSEHYAVYQDAAAGTPWDAFVVDNSIDASNIEANVSFFLHTTFSWAATGGCLIRGQLVPADLSDAPEYAVGGCTAKTKSRKSGKNRKSSKGGKISNSTKPGLLAAASDHMFLEADIGVYPGYTGDIEVSGSVVVTFLTDGTFQFEYDLGGLEGHSESCGIHVHAGTSCDTHEEVVGHGWSSNTVQDFRTATGVAIYATDVDGNTKGFSNLSNGYSFDNFVGHTVVIHAQDGRRVGCGVLLAGV